MNDFLNSEWGWIPVVGILLAGIGLLYLTAVINDWFFYRKLRRDKQRRKVIEMLELDK